MKVVRCKNGHFFDHDKFDRCPYCNEAVPGSAGGNQISADDDVTVSFKENPIDESKYKPPFRNEIYYLDNNNNIVEYEKATKFISKDYDENGRVISESFGVVQKEEKTTPLNDGRKNDDEEKTVGFWTLPDEGKGDKTEPLNNRPKDDDEEKTVGFWTLSDEGKGDKTVPTNNGTDDGEEKTVSFWDLNRKEEEKETATAPANNGNPYGIYFDGVTVPVNEGDWTKTQPPEQPEENAAPVAGWLVCVEGPCRGRDYRLVEGRNFIGRSKEMDVCIPEDAQLSRDSHCSVIYDPRSYRFVVLPGSSAASRLNGENIDGPIDLKDGDILCCGSTKLCFIGYCKEGRDWK